MADSKARYAHKLVTVAQAISVIGRGRRIFIGSGAAQPVKLVEGLALHCDHLCDNEIVHLLTLGPAPYVTRGMERRFRHTAFFIGANVREAVNEGRADFMPVFLSEIPRLIQSRRVRIDVALVQVSPPDEHGYVSLGLSVDVVKTAVDCADLVIAEINPRMPRTHGDSFIHVDRIAHLVETDYPLPERTPEPLDEIDRAIGSHVASLIPDGATLQTGIGRIPDAVLAALGGRHHLGVHTEMFSDGVMKLTEAGVITGRRKTLLPGKIVTSFVMGSAELYRWVHDNPAVEMRPSLFTNDPFNVARNDDMIAINSALAVDLTGQVAADTLMGRFFSGIGGQVDFIRGAARSKGGKPIIALRSTAKDGKVSRIQAAFEAGAGVVTSRGDVHYVVTEHGVADLWGKNIRERAQALIDVAHPDFRPELLAAAKQRRYVLPDQIAARTAYPWEEARDERLPGGERLLLRPVKISDEEALQELFYRLSDDSTYQRFMTMKREHSHQEMLQLVDLDYGANAAIVAVAESDGRDEIVGLTRYDLDPATNLAEIAFVVKDDWQGRGVGTALMRRIAELGRARGLAGFTAEVLAQNRAMLGILQESGLTLESTLDRGVYHSVLRF
jgi:acyl-CoA hydrolase/RimJ/RimL family protein N-acetyltransferase